MAVKVQYDEIHKCIEIKYVGKISNDELLQAFTNAMQISQEKSNVRFLADCSQMIGGHSIIDLYNLIALYEEYNVPHSLKEAIILPTLESILEQVSFYETACLNRGYLVKLFDDKQKATSWLIA